MTQTTKTITFSLPSEMAERVEEEMKRQGQSKDEFLQDAVARHIKECRWREIFRYGQEQAKKMGIKPEDVPRLVEEYRAEVRASGG